jgi:hypothetical protein
MCQNRGIHHQERVRYVQVYIYHYSSVAYPDSHGSAAVLPSVVDPDWIRISLGSLDPNPDPGGQKWPTK